jgi:hypothetical protein
VNIDNFIEANNTPPTSKGPASNEATPEIGTTDEDTTNLIFPGEAGTSANGKPYAIYQEFAS